MVGRLTFVLQTNFCKLKTNFCKQNCAERLVQRSPFCTSAEVPAAWRFVAKGTDSAAAPSCKTPVVRVQRFFAAC